MLNLLSRIPVGSQKPIAVGLLRLSAVAAFFGCLTSVGWFIKTREDCTGVLMFKKCKDTAIPLDERLPFLFFAVGLAVVALVCLFVALRLTTMQGNLNRYRAILTGVESISIERISAITNARASKVRIEIQSMIDSEMIRDFYIDYNSDQVVSKRYVPRKSRKTVVKCSECGGNNELIVGITKPCNFCGQPLLLGTS